MTSENSATRSLQRSANSASPYSSISRLELRPSDSLHLDLDPESLAVEAVLIALIEPPQRLVALEHVLERSPPSVMDSHRVVGRDRAVDEAEARAGAVQLAKLLEGSLPLPELEDLELEMVMVGLVREGWEHGRHQSSV